MWLGLFGLSAFIIFGSFLFFLMKDHQLQVKYQPKFIIISKFGLLLLMVIALGAAVFLYIDWQEQLRYFLTN